MFPLSQKPVEYVRICSLYGAGFYYSPALDTCIRIGGHIRAEVHVNSRGTNLQSWAVGNGFATRTRDRDIFNTRSRVFLNVDTARRPPTAPCAPSRWFAPERRPRRA
ncbi:MAG: porin [Xanthobacteraceae bacterium]